MEYAISLAMLTMYYAQHQVYPEQPAQALKILMPEEGCVLGANRERLVLNALKVPQMTHLLFIDADMGFEPRVLHLLASRRLPFVACNYPLKQTQDPDFSAMRRDGKGRVHTGPDSTGLEEALFTGFGMALIERRVLEAIPAPRFPIVWGKQNQAWSTEDVSFCAFCWERGIPVYVDHDASKLVWHMGKYAYRWKETSDGLSRRVEPAAEQRAEVARDGSSGGGGVQHSLGRSAARESRGPTGVGHRRDEGDGSDR
jgi:hypothetical protein